MFQEDAFLCSAAPEMYEALERLVEEQKYFADKSMQPGMMPGNQFYSDKFMVVVNMAKAALKKSRGEK